MGRGKGTNKKKTTKFLSKEIVTRYGCPMELVNDQGTHSLNEVVGAQTEVFEIKHWNQQCILQGAMAKPKLLIKS